MKLNYKVLILGIASFLELQVLFSNPSYARRVREGIKPYDSTSINPGQSVTITDDGKESEINRVEWNIRAKSDLSTTLRYLFGDYETFISALANPSAFIGRYESDGAFLAEVSNFLSRLLTDSDVLGEIPVSDYPQTRAKVEKLLELAAVRSGNLENILSNPGLYKQVRADNLAEIAEKYGVDMLLVHYLNIRYSGYTILGDNAGLRYARDGKYQTARGIFEDDAYFFTRKVFLGESPYVYSPETGKLYYYGRELPFKFSPIEIVEGLSRDEKTQSKHWYFKMRFDQEGSATGEVDLRYLTINFHNFCTNMCPFCWRAYREKLNFFGQEVMLKENISVDQGLQEIEEAYGSEIFSKIERISVVEGGFKSEQEELFFLEELITKLKIKGFHGRISTFTSFVKNPSGFDKLRELGYQMEDFGFPLESFTRRDEVLGGNKKSTFEKALSAMRLAKKYYKYVRAFLLIGLADNLNDLKQYLPVLNENGIDVQLGAYFVTLPRQYGLLSDDIRRDEVNNGHISFYFEAALIAAQYGVTRPESTITNAIWPANLDKFIHSDSRLRAPPETSSK